MITKPARQRALQWALGICCVAVGTALITFRLMPSSLSDAEIKRVVKAEVGEHLSVFETGAPVKPFKYSDQSKEWEQLSENLAMWLVFNPDWSARDIRVKVSNFERVDAFGQPRARLSAERSGFGCGDQSPGGFPCQKFESFSSGWRTELYVELIQVDGEWRIGHIEPAQALTRSNSEPTYRLCFSYEKEWANCHFALD